MLFLDAADDYIRHIKHERKLATATIVMYVSWLRAYDAWLKGLGHDAPTVEAHFTSILLRRYQQDASERRLRPRSIRGMFFPLRGLGEYLLANKVIAENPVRALTMPKLDAAQRGVVSDEELSLLLGACERQLDKVRIALDRALLSVLIYTGVRASELLDMRLEDVNFAAGTLLIPRGKGNKSRLLYPPRECLDALREWYRVRPDADHDWVWRQDKARRLSIEALRIEIEHVKAIAGLRDATWIKPHGLRPRSPRDS